MKILFVYPKFARHAEANPELLKFVPMNEYLGSPSLGIASIAAVTPKDVTIEFRDDRVEPANHPTDADLVALSFFTAAAKRALELADYFRSIGKTVVAGGIFPTMMPDEVQPHVDAVVVGEGEEPWPRVLADFRAGALKPRYTAGPADLCGVPVPDLSVYFGAESERFQPDDYPFQISRGCPLTCHACALPKTMGSSVRVFPMEQVVGQLEQLTRAGKRACLTEDTSWFPGPGRRRLEELVDHVIAQGFEANISYLGTSMPMILAASKTFLDKLYKAGIRMLYLVGGFDPVTMNAFTGKDARNAQRAHDAIKKAQEAGLEPYTSFLIGNDQDDLGTADRMLDLGAKTNLTKAEFAIFTPYPGTPSWHRLNDAGRILTRDWSKFNDANVVFQPLNFTPDELKSEYLRLWRDFYAPRRESLSKLSITERTIQF